MSQTQSEAKPAGPKRLSLISSIWLDIQLIMAPPIKTAKVITSGAISRSLGCILLHIPKDQVENVVTLFGSFPVCQFS